MASQICANQYDISKAVLNVSRAADVKEEFELQMKSKTNWETYLVPGPMTIALLGELIMISASNDFSIKKNAPKDGYKYIRYLESFRACLMQVANEGYDAFSMAHRNMDEIRLHSMNIPDYIKQIVQILVQGDDQLVQLLLPDHLINMKDISEECTALSAAVENKFSSVIHTVQELLEACVNANKVYQENLEDIQTSIETTKMKEKAAKETKETIEKQMNKMEKFVDEAHSQLNTALNSTPSGLDMVVIDLIHGIWDGFTTLGSSIANICTGKRSAKSKCNTVRREDASENKQVCHIDEIPIYLKSNILLQYAFRLTDYLDKDKKLDMQKVYDARRDIVTSDWIKAGFDEVHKNMAGEHDCAPKHLALEICRMGIHVCNELSALAKSNKGNSNDNTKITEDIQELLNKAETFNSLNKKTTSAPAFIPQSPNMVNMPPRTGGFQSERLCQFKIEQTKQQMRFAQESYDKTFEAMKKANEELNEIIVSMQKLKVKEVDFDKTVKMLIKGMNALGNVKEQWEKMVRFFQMISSHIKICLNKSVKQLGNTSKTILKSVTYTSNSFVRDLIYQQAFQACNIANHVHMISETYTEVSDLYIMDQVSTLGRLIALNPNNSEFEKERAKLAKGCTKAQARILEIVKKKKEEFENKTDMRVKKLETELQPLIRGITPECKKQIEKNVSAGMRPLTTDELSQFC
ncbi:uncharacterized protein LOC122815145 [Protopterus annectens]|uniref:uncharacterized protein LOC122815145 n=1 Tax=Protopterus annectens TaxID=7888 RepID=UPI001CFA76E4|nr:uncharacterized protein LOC122815145 [Protopterus annectens]